MPILRTRPLTYDRAVAAHLIARIAAGEMLRELWRDASLPSRHTLIAWRKANPAFARRLRAAVNAARSDLRTAQSRYQDAAVEAVLERLQAGWSVRDIAADPALPGASAIRDWLRTRPDFRRQAAIARQCYADAMAEQGWELALAATPASARAVGHHLAHLRWRVGKLAAKRYTLDYEDPSAAPKTEPAARRRALRAGAPVRRSRPCEAAGAGAVAEAGRAGEAGQRTRSRDVR